MTTVGQILDTILFAFIVLLFARLVVDLVMMFARSWQPHGVVLLLVEVVFTVTDPPLKAVRRVVPPLRIGGVALDIAFFLVVIAVSLLRAVVAIVFLRG